MASSSRLGRFTLAETVLHQSVEVGFLDMEAGIILGQVGWSCYQNLLDEAIVLALRLGCGGCVTD